MKPKIVYLLLSFFVLSLLPPSSVYADYVLPYPGYMPGNKLYKVSRLFDKFGSYWHWGAIASFKYYLALSDKYLVEAKTLFEYKQYLLAVDALQRSNEHFQRLPQLLTRVTEEEKDARKLTARTTEAAVAHIQVLEKLKNELPAEFTWSPEKQNATTLKLEQLLDEAMSLRKL
ncbi:MAG: hypothetical protein US50_C0047G0005 [Candidatus Nomurabacteria bacterium GW2011_GWB1_37_5]|uniref:DUF5667 domain-containing protein n=1 Tax=Candidatus Nomurabacteria bacterium GW2011_GWB1_37_5 TaxID=1618742 RepID=A0A0G0GTU6_9BACT|nr:MAG: hypothetical protein US50_C0047G0005 [Candidatus Nomurabacteria bacterium GW2011_GWB1_37_5]